MDFSWIKRLFKIKSTTNVSDVGISTIDTSFIKVPRLSDLSKENQDKVMEYFNEIKYDNYETIVKYSDSLLEKSNREIDFFVHDLEDSIKNISAILKEVNKNNYFKLLLYREEIKLSIEELNKIEQEAELRLIALDTYIKKEERRKYDFLGIFGRAERLRYLSDKSSLLNERQRLLITIKLNKQHLQIIYNTLNENKELLDTMNNYINCSKLFDTTYYPNIYDEYVKYVIIKRNIIRKLNKCDSYQEDYLDLLNTKSISYFNIIVPTKQAEQRYHELTRIDKIVPILAKNLREIKQYAYEHRNDYKTIISEINTLVSKYEQEFRTNHFSEWNIEEIKQNTIKYANSIELLTRICGRYLNSDNYDELIKKMTNLAFYLLIGDNFNFNGYLNVYYGNDVVSYAEKASSVHFDKCIKLLDEVLAKHGINESIFDEIAEEDEKKIAFINRFILQLINNNEVKYLYDLLRDDFDIYKITYQDELLFSYDWAARLLIYHSLAINGQFLRGFKSNKARQELLDSITIKKLGIYDYNDLKFYKHVPLCKIAESLKFIGINKFDEKLLINRFSPYIMFNENIQINDLLRIIYDKIFIDRIRKEEKEEIILTIPSIIKLSKDYNAPFNKSIIYLEDSDDLDNLNILRYKKFFGYCQKNPTFENLKVVFINYTLAKKFLENKDYEIVNSEHAVVAQSFSKKKKNIIDVKSWEILNKKNTDFYQIYCYDSYSFGEEFRLYAVPDNTKVQDIQEYIINNSKKTVNEKLLSKMI